MLEKLNELRIRQSLRHLFILCSLSLPSHAACRHSIGAKAQLLYADQQERSENLRNRLNRRKT